MSCKIDFVKDWELRYQGAESRIYFGSYSDNRCVIKHRFSKKYRHPVLDKKLTKERTKRERRIIEKIKSKSKELGPHLPRVIWSDDSTLLMTEMVNCETVYSYVEREREEAPNIAQLIGRCVAELHNLGIIHGDLTTSNLILSEKNQTDHEKQIKKVKTKNILESFVVVPIDFGLSTGSTHPEERAVDLYVLERALLSTHFPDSTFFNIVLDTYLMRIDEKTCEPLGKQKIVERLHEVRARGRKSDYSSSQEA